MDGSGLLPDPAALRPGPGREAPLELESRSDVEAGDHLVRVERRVPEGRASPHRGAEQADPVVALLPHIGVHPGHVLEVSGQGEALHGPAGLAVTLEVEGAEGEAALQGPLPEEVRLLAGLHRAEAVKVEEAEVPSFGWGVE